MDIKNIVSVTKFTYKDNEYYALATYDNETRKIGKIVLDSSFKETTENPEMTSIQVQSGIKIEGDEKKLFLKEYSSSIKNEEKEQKKSDNFFEKQNRKMENDALTDEYYSLKTAEERNQFLSERGIKEGQVYEIKTKSLNKQTGEEETSKAYLEVFKKKNGELGLRLDTKDSSLKSDTNSHQIGNVENLAGVNALALISDKFASNRLNAMFQKSGLDDRNFSDYEISFERKDISKKILKQREENQKNKIKALRNLKENTKETEEINTVVFSKVPEMVKKIYEEKNRPIDEHIYTAKIFEMFHNIAAVPKEDRNISKFDQKAFSDIISSMEKFNGDIEKQKKVFNQWVFDNERSNNDRLINLGYLFEKTRDKHFTGYEIQRSEYEKEQREKNLEALKNNLLPFMTPKNSVDYIHAADDNKIYSGETQLALQRNNLTNGYNTDCYANLPSLISNNVLGHQPMKVSCEIVDLGQDSYGHNHYQLLVPVKPSFKERLKARAEEKKTSKMEKELRNLEYKKNVQDALFKKKYGTLPVYETSVQPVPVNQPPIMKPNEIRLQNERPAENSSTAEKVRYDMENFFKCMFTKEPFVPQTDWTSKEAKQALEEFIKTNPEKYSKAADEAYTSVQSQVRAKARANENVNQNIMENENKNIKTNGRKI